MTQDTHRGTALITGGAKRIGRSLALALAEKGYDIALHYHTSQREADALSETIKQRGRRCLIYPCDLMVLPDVNKMVAQVFHDFSDCNILINNASLFERFSFQETDETVFDDHFSLNIKAPFFLTKYFAEHCKNGVVLNMLDSYVSKSASPYFAYLLSKKTLHEFTRMAALTLGPAIRVNGIAPGLTELSTDEDHAFLERKKKILPLRQIAKIDYIVAAALQLLEAEYLTGQVLNVDGGEHLL